MHRSKKIFTEVPIVGGLDAAVSATEGVRVTTASSADTVRNPASLVYVTGSSLSMPTITWNPLRPNCGSAATASFWLAIRHDNAIKKNLPATENRERAKTSAIVAVTNTERKRTIIV
jgi:hypothetical protein